MRPTWARTEATDDERGSALVMAVFVLVLLTGMGTALLFMTQTEVNMSQAGLRSKAAFFYAEAGLEHARMTLFNLNGGEPFGDDLLAAANSGSPPTIDFDPTAVRAVRDGNGNVTAFTGFGNDVPLISRTALDDGWYAGFLTNDPAEPLGISSPVDTNDRVMLTGVGAGSDGSFEVVQAIIEIRSFVPGVPPATITLLGPSPAFGGSSSKVKDYIGDDCDGAGLPIFVPVVGTIGAAAEADAEAGIDSNPDYDSGGYSDADTFADLLDSAHEPTLNADIDPAWNNCQNLHDMIDGMRDRATVVCTNGDYDHCPGMPPNDPARLIFAEGDFDVLPGSFAGTLAVTGRLTVSGNTSWQGLILVIGEGEYVMNGAGHGVISGGILVADVAGPDNVFGTADDCTGPDGGFGSVIYDERGGGNSGTIYCTTDLIASNPIIPYDIEEFLQH
jgi:hypothetical protein